MPYHCVTFLDTADGAHPHTQPRSRPQSAKVNAAVGGGGQGLRTGTLPNAAFSAVKLEAEAQRWNKPPVPSVGPVPFSAHEKLSSKNLQGPGWNTSLQSATSLPAGALVRDVQNLTQQLQQNQHKQSLELWHRNDESHSGTDRNGTGKNAQKLSLRAPDLGLGTATEPAPLESQLSGVRYRNVAWGDCH